MKLVDRPFGNGGEYNLVDIVTSDDRTLHENIPREKAAVFVALATGGGTHTYITYTDLTPMAQARVLAIYGVEHPSDLPQGLETILGAIDDPKYLPDTFTVRRDAVRVYGEYTVATVDILDKAGEVVSTVVRYGDSEEDAYNKAEVAAKEHIQMFAECTVCHRTHADYDCKET